jgi:hypothetical protein
MRYFMRTAWLALVALGVCSHSANVSGRSGEVHVRITSPLGRTGSVGTVRIVAQIDPAPEGVIDAVRIYVDGTLLKTVTGRLTLSSGWTPIRSSAASWRWKRRTVRGGRGGRPSYFPPTKSPKRRR